LVAVGAGRELEVIREWFRYNAHVRDRYLNALLRLPRPEQLRDRGASFPSLNEIFAHVLNAYRSWFQVVARNDFAGYQPVSGEGVSPAELRRAVRETNALVFGYLDGLSPSDIGKTLRASWVEGGHRHRKRITVRDMLWHLVEEELQHRGELNALLWQCDIDPPVWGWDDWRPRVGADPIRTGRSTTKSQTARSARTRSGATRTDGDISTGRRPVQR
jgi:uncharacterized damage-inducible protein DinB